MQVLRWSAAAALAAIVSLTPSYAGDDLSAMKASMDNMKIEMEAMRSQLNAEREALRSNAGGAPEGILSAKGNATLRIGGDVRIQYGIGTASGYGRQHYVAWDEGGVADRVTTGERSVVAGWEVARAQLDFDVDLSCDTKGFISLRFDENGSYPSTGILDQAYWQWNNVGGSGFGLKIGLMDIPFGMWANTDMGGYDFDGVDRPLITNPFVRSVSSPIFTLTGQNGHLFAVQDPDMLNVTNLGLLASYSWDDQIVLKAGIMSSAIDSNHGNFPLDNLTYANEIRNIGFIDHIVTVGYNPCWLEGLHVEASYMGRFDEGRAQVSRRDANGFPGLGVFNNPYDFNYTQNQCGDTDYKPSFDIGVVYKVNDQLRAYAEGVFSWSPYYADGYSYAMTPDRKADARLRLRFLPHLFHWRLRGPAGDEQQRPCQSLSHQRRRQVRLRQRPVLPGAVLPRHRLLCGRRRSGHQGGGYAPAPDRLPVLSFPAPYFAKKTAPRNGEPFFRWAIHHILPPPFHSPH